MVYINGKILLRSSETKPFVYVDPETLKEEEVELDFEGIEGPTIEWKTNEETGRSLTYSPLMFDGTYLYMISRNKAVKNKEEIKNEDEEEKARREAEEEELLKQPPKLVLECFDPKDKFKFVSSVILKKNSEANFVKSDNSEDWLKETNFATNGKHLFV